MNLNIQPQDLDLLFRTLGCCAIAFILWGILTAIKGLWEKVEEKERG